MHNRIKGSEDLISRDPIFVSWYDRITTFNPLSDYEISLIYNQFTASKTRSASCIHYQTKGF